MGITRQLVSAGLRFGWIQAKHSLSSCLWALVLTGCGDAISKISVQSEAALEAASSQTGERLPVFTGEPSAMCRGVKFIGKDRLVQEGTKPCDGGAQSCNLTNLTASNIRIGVTIAGTVGSMPPPQEPCKFAGQQNCVASGRFYGGVQCEASGSSGCYLPHYSAVTQPLMAIDFDRIDARKLRASTSIAGKSGTLVDCTFDGATGCIVTGIYRAADMTKISGGVIKKGVTIAGVSGLYPSGSYPLIGADSTTNLPAFASVSGGATYQWFQADGTRLTGTV